MGLGLWRKIFDFFWGWYGGEIEGLYVSCRALERGIEAVLLAAAARWAKACGARALEGAVVFTPRNAPVRTVYEKAGFACVESDAAGSRWRLDLAAGAPDVPPWLAATLPDPP